MTFHYNVYCAYIDLNGLERRLAVRLRMSMAKAKAMAMTMAMAMANANVNRKIRFTNATQMTNTEWNRNGNGNGNGFRHKSNEHFEISCYLLKFNSFFFYLFANSDIFSIARIAALRASITSRYYRIGFIFYTFLHYI